jgi:hypothetical protein
MKCSVEDAVYVIHIVELHLGAYLKQKIPVESATYSRALLA